MARDVRRFDVATAIRDRTYHKIGYTGVQGSGKTFSMLRTALGITMVAGGKIVFLDTENGRAKDYAPRKGCKADNVSTFDFEWIDFQPPYSPVDYIDAFNYALSLNPTVIIADSMSHEHDGPGGVLEWHEAEMRRLLKDDDDPPEWKLKKFSFPAWAKPKEARRKLVQLISLCKCHVLEGFRADEKTAMPEKGSENKELIKLGFMPIGGKPYLYDMKFNLMFPPGAEGKPDWHTVSPAQEAFIKKPPIWARPYLSSTEPRQIDEQFGIELAKWSMGGDEKPPQAESAHDTQIKAMAGRLKALGDSGRFKNLDTGPKRLTWISTQLGRKIEKLSEITEDELARLVAFVGEME